MDYDVIVAGGSFAGLAAAVQLKGKRVLMVEPHAIGAVQTSACGTLLAVLEATAATESLCQVHDHIVIHLGERAHEYPLLYPFCTFDYRAFCYRLLAQADTELLHASVLGHRGHIVYTTKGAFDAEVLIDATGWRAALSTGARQRFEPRIGRSFGLETVIPIRENGLHFYYDLRKWRAYNVGWLFPTGAFSRVGFGNYRGETRLNAILRHFAADYFGGSPDGIHGGFWPCRRQPATSGHVFRIGDAAGQCLPFTGEGIRPALYFGATVGCLARRVLDGEMRESDALLIYRAVDKRHLAITHRLLLATQKIVPGLPMGWIERLAGLIQRPARINALMQLYWEVVNPKALAQLWSGAPAAGLPASDAPTALDDLERSAQ